VVIDVRSKDLYPAAVQPKLNGIAGIESETFSTNDIDGIHGKLSIDDSGVSKVCYGPNSMEMPSQDTFRYQAKFAFENEDLFLNSTAPVISATSIYYEYSFVSFDVRLSDSSEKAGSKVIDTATTGMLKELTAGIVDYRRISG
jgi:hypothetical protein